METANILLALGGDAGNQIYKAGVTAAEIAVLRAIHGDGAVTDIEPTATVKRSHREERSRLLSVYGRMVDGKDESPVSVLFPGAAARVFESLVELELPAELYKASGRVVPKAVAQEQSQAEAPGEGSNFGPDGNGDDMPPEPDGIDDMPSEGNSSENSLFG